MNNSQSYKTHFQVNISGKKNLLLLQLFLVILLMYGCTEKSQPNLPVYRALASSLNKSNNFITSKNLILIESLDKKTLNPANSAKAKIWISNARLVQQKVDSIMAYIDSLKRMLKNEAGLKIINGQETINEKDLDAVPNVFIKNGEGEKLKQRIIQFEDQVLGIDQQMKSRLRAVSDMDIRLSDPNETKKTFAETFFTNIPVVAGIAVLCKFQNNIKLFENDILSYCEVQVPD